MSVTNDPCPCGHAYQAKRHKRACAEYRQSVIDELRRLAVELGRAPTQNAYLTLRRPDMPGYGFIRQYFWETWPDALNAAGLAIDYSVTYYWELER